MYLEASLEAHHSVLDERLPAVESRLLVCSVAFSLIFPSSFAPPGPCGEDGRAATCDAARLIQLARGLPVSSRLNS
jgi:hypothetical protein